MASGQTRGKYTAEFNPDRKLTHGAGDKDLDWFMFQVRGSISI